MALFGSKKNTVEKTQNEPKPKAVKATKSTKKTESAIAVRDVVSSPIVREVILRPRVTEKSGIMNESQNVYTFEVTKNATKHSIAQAIKSLYKVTPIKVRTTTLPEKQVFVRGRFGTQSAIKKALVYLKKGDKIEVV